MSPHQFPNGTQNCTIAGGGMVSLDHRVAKDINEQANSISGWSQTYEQLSPGTFLGQTVDLCFNDIQLFRETTHQHLYQKGCPRPGCYVLGVPIAMKGRAVFSGQALDRDHLMILQGSDALDFCTPRYFDVVALVLPTEPLRQFAMQVANLDLQGLHSGVRSPHPSVVSSWRTFLLSVLDAVCTTPHQLNHPNLRRALSQEIFWNLSNVLESLQSAISPPPVPLSRRQVISQARDYLEAHIDEPVTITDLCITLNVSRRTLQYSFKDLLDINPIRYFKAIRLNNARRDLHARNAYDTTMGDIAAKWGFWHFGRFSSEYCQMFGELPSVTLRQFKSEVHQGLIY